MLPLRLIINFIHVSSKKKWSLSNERSSQGLIIFR
nr:MAG TPA: hypothetical protein [Caudoviricetes sp.]